MLKALSKWFGESQMTIPEDKVLQCKHESHTYSCDLVEELKLKQAERRRVYQEMKDIPAVVSMSFPGITKCTKVIKESAHNYNLRKVLSREYMETYGVDLIVSILNNIMVKLETDDVNQVCDDLKRIRERQALVDSKNSRLTQLDIEIHELKLKLGID